MTLLFLLIMGVVASALVFTVQGEMRASASYKYSQQSYYVANAGVQKYVEWVNNSYTPHLPAADFDQTTLPVRTGGADVLLAGQTGSTSVYPDDTVKTTFAATFSNQSLQGNDGNAGVYALNASLRKYWPATFINPDTFVSYPSAIERWEVKSRGYWGTVANPMGIAEITATIENSGNALFDRALWGIDSVSLTGTVLIDSYDPALGPYGGTNIGYAGSVGSNGNISTNGNVTVKGDLAYGPSGSYSQVGNVNVTGQITALPEPHYFPPLPPITIPAGSPSYSWNNGAHNLPEGNYSTINVGANSTLTLGAGDYYIDTLTMGAQATIIVTGATTLHIKSGITLDGQGIINATGDPGNLSIFYEGTNPATLVGGSGFYGSIYAPNGSVTLKGNSSFFGAFIGKTVNDSGTPDIHFDEGSLQRNLIQRPFRLITWSQNTY